MSERGSGGARLEAFPCGKTPRRLGDTMPDIDGEPQVLLARAVELTKAGRQARDEADAALAARDEALARAHAAGVTMYRLSKGTHLSKTATRVAIMRASPELQKKDR